MLSKSGKLFLLQLFGLLNNLGHVGIQHKRAHPL